MNPKGIRSEMQGAEKKARIVYALREYMHEAFINAS